jgi:hypothetical protein
MSKITQLRDAAEKARLAAEAEPANEALKKAAEAAQKALDDAEAAAQAKPVKVRVLVDHQGHKCDDVVTLSADDAEAAAAAGWADAHPSAVAFAEKEKRKKAQADD